MKTEPQIKNPQQATPTTDAPAPEKPSAATHAEPTEPAKKSDPVRRFTLVVLTLAIILFVWYVFADRYAPWTDQARVEGFIVPITPKVSGKVIKVNVIQDQLVEAGELLLQIDPREYELAINRAESALQLAGQETGASTAAVRAAEAALDNARVELDRARRDLDRLQGIYQQDSGAVSKADMDRAQAAVGQAKAQEANALAELEKTQEQLGAVGQDNARIRDAVAALEQARIDLADTSLYAPSPGGITNLRIDEGQYAKEGTPLMTFLSATDVWIKAYMRENSLGHIKAGDQVDIAMDAAPGKIFPGVVASIGFAVSQPSGGAAGELETVRGASGWLRDAQRFPVLIHFADDSASGLRRYGAQVDVQIYTGDNPMLNGLGRFWIWLMSQLSYVY